MRRRLLGAILGVAVVVVVVFGIPLGIVGTRLVRSGDRERLERQAGSAALVVEAAADPLAVSAADLAAVVAPSTGIDVVLADGSRHHLVGPSGGSGDPEATAVVRPGVAVVARTSGAHTADKIRDAWLAVAAAAVLALGVAALLARREAPRLARPLQELAAVSPRLGAGDFTARAAPCGIPEIDAVAERLNASSGQLAELPRREREFSANASHQLRTALTALRLPIEELAVTADAASAPAIDRALRQADRLEHTVEDLLALARLGALGALAPYRVAPVLADAVATWTPILERRGRRLAAEVDGDPHVLGSATTLAQVLDVLVDNAVRYGAGTVSIAVEEDAGAVVVAVSDEGRGIPPDDEARIFERGHGRGTGLGLAVARELVAAEEGRLVLAAARPPRFAVVLTAPPSVS